MARHASLVHLDDQIPPATDQLAPNPRIDGIVSADDRLDFDSWLLPPEVPTVWERMIRLCSMAAGPVAFAIGLGCVLAWIA
jgi:hypothetical protein